MGLIAMAKRRTRRTKASRKRSRSKSRLRRPGLPNFSELSQTQIDVLGLALAALGAFFAFVFYGGWEGGKVGEALATGLQFVLGSVAYLVPALLVLVGLGLIARPLVEEPGRPRLGVAILILALTLGFAAGTLGLGPGAETANELFNPDSFMDRGGLVGAGLYWVTTTLFSSAGAHIAFAFGLLGGILLVTGGSLSTLARRAVEVLSYTVRAARAWIKRAFSSFANERERARSDARASKIDYEEPEGEPRVMAIGEHEPVSAEPQSFAAEIDALEPEADLPLPSELDDPSIQERTRQPELTPMGNKRSEVTESDELDYRLPDASVLRKSDKSQGPDASNQAEISDLLVETLGHFGIEAHVTGRVTGPRVTQHELRLAPGTKVAKVTALKDDLAYALAATDIRILAPIPGKQAVGVEVPNKLHRMVFLGDIFRREVGAKAPKKAGKKVAPGTESGTASPLAVWLGKDIAGNAVWTDLAKMPHVLVAGTTGSGKSGCINTMLSSILLRSSPNQVRMVLVDPKRVELNHYEDIPHLLTPVVTNPRMAANVLSNLISEMESRYELMGRSRARNIIEMNRIRAAANEPQLPYILTVIDELADLMMVAPSEVEDSIIRLAQKSRAVGIHLVLATQRPSVDIITGTIKVNIPARVAFAVSSQHDSRVILDGGGAEALLGQGDMLFRPVGSSKLQRIQGAYITEDEIARITGAWRDQGEPEYEQELLEGRPADEAAAGEFDPDEDDLLERAVTLVAQTQTASVSMLQRRLRVGYTRAGRLIDMLERRGVITGYEGSKPRQVLITEGDVQRVMGQGELPAQAVPAAADAQDSH